MRGVSSKRSKFRPILEELDQKICPTRLSLDGGQLIIRDDPVEGPNSLYLQPTENGTLLVWDDWQTLTEIPDGWWTWPQMTWAAEGPMPESIEVHLGAGDDRLDALNQLGETINPVPVNLSVYAGSGSDEVQGGAGDDLLVGGDG